MVSFPRAALGAIADRHRRPRALLQLHDRDRARAVPAVHRRARARRPGQPARRTGGGESFQFAPRIAAVPERLKQIWWVRRLPQMIAMFALLVAVVVPLLSDRSERHQTWTIILAFALCAVSVVVLTGWGGQLSLGQMAFAGLGALTAAALGPRVSVDIGWRDTRIVHGHVALAVVSVDADPRGGRSRASWRCSSVSARCACGGCSSRSARSRSRSRRRSTSSTARSSPPDARPCRSRAPTSARSSSPTRTAPTTTSCCSCSSSCCCSSDTSGAPASGASIVGVRENELGAAALTRVAGARQAHRVRARRVRRRARRRAARRPSTSRSGRASATSSSRTR